MKNQNSLWSMPMVVLIQTISAAASCLIHSFSAPISGTVQIEIKRTNRGSRISQFRNGLHNFAFIFFLQKREKIVQNLISFYNMAILALAQGLNPLTPEQLREVVRVTSNWRKDVNIPHYKSLQEICFRSCDIFPLKRMSMKIFWKLSLALFFNALSLFSNAILLHVCIYFIKNRPIVLHKYFGTDCNTFSLYGYTWPRPRTSYITIKLEDFMEIITKQYVFHKHVWDKETIFKDRIHITLCIY